MIKIVTLVSLIAYVCAGGVDVLSAPHAVAPLGLPSYLSSNLLAPHVLSRVVSPSVLSVPAVAARQVTVAEPTAVAVEKVSVGSVPSYSVVNEPTSIVTPGKPIRGHSFTSEVRHDSIARVAAPLIATYSSPVLSAPILDGRALAAPLAAPLTTHYATPLAAPLSADYAAPLAARYATPLSAHYAAPLAAEAVGPEWAGLQSTLVSAPQVYATGPASVVAAPASVTGYTREVGRTELVNELRLRAASIPATLIQDNLVESVPTVVSQPLITKSLLSGPLISTLIKKK